MPRRTFITGSRTALRRTGAARALVLALVLAGCFTAGRLPVVTAQGGGCTLPPVTLPLFQGTPAATIATPAVPMSGLTSRSLTEAQRAETESAVRTIVDCVNTGVPKEVYAVFTPRYLAALFTGPTPSYQPAFEQMIAEGAGTIAQTRTALVLSGVKDGKMLGDGRIAVTVDLATAGTAYHDTLVLAWIDGHWLIDDVAAFNPPVATPPAG